MGKKLLIVCAGFVGILIAAAIVVPLLFDVNKFRPSIVKAVEENLDADFEIGNLKLSLWGGLNIGVEKMILSEKGSKGQKPIFKMNDFSFDVSLASIFKAKPQLTLAVSKPEITIVKGTDGVLNVMKIMKPGAKVEATQTKKSDGSIAMGAVPAFFLGIRISKGAFTYKDLVAGTSSSIKDMDFTMDRVTLNEPVNFSFDGDLVVKMMKDLVLEGPLALNGKFGVYLSGSGFERLDLESKLNMTGLIVKFGTMLNKTGKDELEVDTKLSATQTNLKLEKLLVQVGDAHVSTTGTVNNFDAPILDIKVASSNFVLDKWKNVIGPLKDFDMSGAANFDLTVKGPVSNVAINGKAVATGIGLKAPGIVPRVTDINSQLNFTMDSVTLSKTSLKMGDSDIKAEGTVQNFKKPVIRVSVNSDLLNVDSLMPAKPQSASASEPAAAAPGDQGAPAAAQVDVEKAAAAPVAAMKKNPIARGVDFEGKVNFKKIIANKAELTDVTSQASFKDLVFKMSKTGAKVFKGQTQFDSTVDFRGDDPAYSVSGKATGIDINFAMTNQMPTMAETILGQMNAEFSVNGSGLSKAKVTKSLKGSGKYDLQNGAWSSLTVMKTIGEKLKSIPGAQDKVKNINVSGKFRELRSKFGISDGKFNIIDLVADLEEANTGLTGNGWVDFDQNFFLEGKIIAPAEGDLPKDLRASDGKRMSLPYELGCKVKPPCVKYDKTVSFVAKAFGKKEIEKAASKGLEELKKVVPQEHQQKAEEAAKGLLKGLGF